MNAEALTRIGQLLGGAWPYTAIPAFPLLGLFLAIASRPQRQPSQTTKAVHREPPAIPLEQVVRFPPPETLPAPVADIREPPCSRDAQRLPGEAQVGPETASPNIVCSILGQLADAFSLVRSPSRPRVIQHSSQHLDIYLDQPCLTAPDGWAVDADGSIWTCDTNRAESTTSEPRPAPLLVTLGAPDDSGQLYLDLEAAGVTALIGDQEEARHLARAILSEVVHGPMSDTIRVTTIGDLTHPCSPGLERVTIAESWDEVDNDVIGWADQSHQALEAHGWANPFVGRGTDPQHDALTPFLVLASEPPPARTLSALSRLAPTAVSVVVIGAVAGAGCVIDCQPGALQVVDLGLTCMPGSSCRDRESASAPKPAPRDEVREAPARSNCAGVTGVRSLDVPGGDASFLPPPTEPSWPEIHPRRGSPDGRPHQEPPFEILVRLLGDIRVDGGRPLRTKPTAVLAYIALHRTVSIEILEDACWGDAQSTSLRRRLKDVMSECRAGVGSQHLPASTDGRYRVGDGVVTDLELFDLRVARAAGEPLEQQADTYRSALELVTGRIFTYPGRAASSFGWIDTENLLSQWEIKVERLALHCIEAHFCLGAAERAAEMAVHALNALPLNVVLTEALMRSHAAAGDSSAVDTVYRAHVDGLARVHDADPDESTQRLYRDLYPVRIR